MRILSPIGATAGGGDAASSLPARARRAAPLVLDALTAGAALIIVRVGALALTPSGAPPRPYAALALGCASAALIGGLTAARAFRARRPLAIAWALILLWPLAGPPAAAASLAVLGCAGVVARTVRLHWGALLAVVAAALLVTAVQRPESKRTAVFTGVAAAPPRAPHHGSPARTTPAVPQPSAAPDAAVAPPPRSAHAGRPKAAVLAYYRALDARQFERAWRMLAPTVRSSFGGRARWHAGFATTRTSRPSLMRVAALDAAATTVRHVLTATDRTPCGGLVVRRYAITWTLKSIDGGWRAAALAGHPLAGHRTALKCGSLP